MVSELNPCTVYNKLNHSNYFLPSFIGDAVFSTHFLKSFISLLAGIIWKYSSGPVFMPHSVFYIINSYTKYMQKKLTQLLNNIQYS